MDTLTCKICKNIVVSQNSKKSLIKIRKFYNEILVINNGTLDYSNKIPHDKFLYEKYFDKNKIIVGSIGVLEKKKRTSYTYRSYKSTCSRENSY